MRGRFSLQGILSIVLFLQGFSAEPLNPCGLSNQAQAEICSAVWPIPFNVSPQIDAVIKTARRGHLELEINWSVDQAKLPLRPDEVSIIAVLIGLRSEYRATANARISGNTPLEGTTGIAIDHAELYSKPTDAHFVISVAFRRNNSGNGLPSGRRDFLLRVNETN